MNKSIAVRLTALIAAALLATGCQLLPFPIQASTMEVDGVTVTCRISDSSIEGSDTLGQGPESQSLCISRAREAMGTVLGAQPRADIESVDVAANGSATVCYTVNGVKSCPQVLPAMPTL